MSGSQTKLMADLVLPSELWVMIFKHGLDTKDLRQVSLACKLFCTMTRPLLFTAVVLRPNLSFVSGKEEQRTEDVAQNALCFAQVEHITSSKIAPHIRRLSIDKALPNPGAPNMSQETARSLPDAMELLISRAQVLVNITEVHFGDTVASFKLLDALCGVDRQDRAPLDEVVIDNSIIDQEDWDRAPPQMRIKRVSVSGEIGESSDTIHSLIHPDTIEGINIALCVCGWDETLLTREHHQFPRLTKLELTHERRDREDCVDLASLRDVLSRAPALEVLMLPKVEFERSSIVPEIIEEGVCPLLNTLAAQIHVVRALLPGRPIRNLCLLGAPETYENGAKRIYSLEIGGWINHGNELYEQLEPLEPMPGVHKLCFLTRSSEPAIYVKIWELFPDLVALDVRIEDADELDQLHEVSLALTGTGVRVPRSLERLTIHGVDLVAEDESIDEDEDSEGEDLGEVVAPFRDAVCEHFRSQPDARLRHVELVSLDEEAPLLFNPFDKAAVLEAAPLEDWVPYSKVLNKRSAGYVPDPTWSDDSY